MMRMFVPLHQMRWVGHACFGVVQVHVQDAPCGGNDPVQLFDAFLGR